MDFYMKSCSNTNEDNKRDHSSLLVKLQQNIDQTKALALYFSAAADRGCVVNETNRQITFH